MQHSLLRSLSVLLCLLTLAAALFALGGCSAEKPVMTVGDYPITREEYLYFYNNFAQQYEYETGVTEETVRADVEQALRRKYAVQALADAYHVTPDADDRKEAESLAAQYRDEYGGAQSFAEALASWSMSESYFRSLLMLELLETKLRAVMSDPYTGDIPADDESVRADVRAHFYHAKQIFVAHTAGEDLTEHYARAAEARERAAAGEDFDTLIAEYGEDDYLVGQPDGYYFTDGQLLEVFEETVRALEIGEISEVVASDIGYHVILRLPLEEAQIEARLDSLREAYLARTVNERLAAAAAAFPITYTEAFDSVSLPQIH